MLLILIMNYYLLQAEVYLLIRLGFTDYFFFFLILIQKNNYMDKINEIKKCKNRVKLNNNLSH